MRGKNKVTKCAIGREFVDKRKTPRLRRIKSNPPRISPEVNSQKLKISSTALKSRQRFSQIQKEGKF